MDEASVDKTYKAGIQVARVLIAPDKFKGSLSATQVADALATGLQRGSSRLDVRTLPLADGGDGSVEAALDAGFEPLTAAISGPLGTPATTIVAINDTTAVVEVATTSGLQMLPPEQRSPLSSSSVGVGQAVRAALDYHPRRLVLALGGSATTDGGAGMLSGLGAVFRNASGESFVPTGGTLGDITEIDFTDLVDLSDVELVAANDVWNPLLGHTGTAAVYGPQKGASNDDIAQLEAGLQCLVRRVRESGRHTDDDAPGAGAAGGLGYAAMLLGAEMVSGADYFLDLLGFDEQVADCDLVITGEGKLDEQTLSGKLPLAVAKRAAPVPVLAVVGHSSLGASHLPEHGIRQVHALSSMTDRDSAADPTLSTALLSEVGRHLGRTMVTPIARPGRRASSNPDTPSAATPWPRR